MAYIQDISVLMRELLKVPKDYTPTAVEISKYIRSRYNKDQSESSVKRPMGSRGFSSASRSAPPRVTQDVARQLVQQPQKPLRLVDRQKMSGRRLTYSTLQPNEKLKQQLPPRNPVKATPQKVEKKAFTTTAPKRTVAKRNFQMKDVWDQKPKSAPPPASPAVEPPLGRQSFWNWKSAKSHIRRAMSDLVIPSHGPKNKLALLSEQVKLDPKTEEALEAKRKDMLRDMVDPDITEREPLRTREIIQRLLEENKLEDQRKEIARLTEMARTKVMEARKSNYVSTKIRKRREERL